jgi:hypothetical protein
VLYVFISDSAEDSEIALRDKFTGARLNLGLRGQHAALALIDRQSKTVAARYGF